MVLTQLKSVAYVQNFPGVKDVLTMSNQLTGSTSQLKKWWFYVSRRLTGIHPRKPL